METQILKQEILLILNTSLTKRELCEMDEPNANKTKYSQADQLEKACWSSWLFETLGALVCNNYVWKVNQAEQFILVELGILPDSMEYKTSIDPYLFSVDINYS